MSKSIGWAARGWHFGEGLKLRKSLNCRALRILSAESVGTKRVALVEARSDLGLSRPQRSISKIGIEIVGGDSAEPT